MIKVLIAEDNSRIARAIIEKLKLFDDIEIMGWEPNGKALLERLESEPAVDLVLMDINMPLKNGIDTTAELKKKYPHIKVVMSTVFDDENSIFLAILAGANGYLLKDEKPQKFYEAIQEALSGGAPMSATVARKALNMIRYQNEQKEDAEVVDYKLTKREQEVLELLSTGINYNQIADKLFISSGTVRKHIENIYQKLQVHNKMEAVQLAMKNKLI